MPRIARSFQGGARLGDCQSPIWRQQADRRANREECEREGFGSDHEAALDLLELTEFAWHDCYGEVTPPDQVVDDMLVVAQGSLAGLARAARLDIKDSRDLRLRACDLT